MDTTDPAISFDEGGVCNHCRNFDAIKHSVWHPDEQGRVMLERELERVRAAGRSHEYDCVIGLSGGVDSSYLAYLSREWGLRTLVVHVDCGWNSENAVRNIEVLVKKIGLDLYTHVVDWEEMRDLQVAFLRSSLANQDVPQDHVIFAATYKFAARLKIPYVLTGNNFATESILPETWGYDAFDSRQLKAIHRLFGRNPLKQYTIMDWKSYYLLWNFLPPFKRLAPLNYLPYDKQAAKRTLIEELGWSDYGCKHGESRFTRFFQNYYLPTKFGYDKRLPHLSSMIVSRQITREAALEEMRAPLYDVDVLRQDREYFLKKLALTEEEFTSIMELPRNTFRDYPNVHGILCAMRNVKRRIRGFKR